MDLIFQDFYILEYEIINKSFFEMLLKLSVKQHQEIENVYRLYGKRQNTVSSMFIIDLLALIQSNYFDYDYFEIIDKIESVNMMFKFINKIRINFRNKYN